MGESKSMTVGELKKILEGYPDDLLVKIDIGEGLPGWYEVGKVEEVNKYNYLIIEVDPN